MTDDFLLLKVLTIPLPAAVGGPFAWRCLCVMWYWLITDQINYVAIQEDGDDWTTGTREACDCEKRSTPADDGIYKR